MTGSITIEFRKGGIVHITAAADADKAHRFEALNRLRTKIHQLFELEVLTVPARLQ